MKRRLPALLLAWAGLWPASGLADLTLTGYSATGAFGMPMTGLERIHVRGTTIRRDHVGHGRLETQIFDLAGRRVAVMVPAERSIEIHDLSGLRAATGVAAAPAGDMKVALKPTGQSRPLGHWQCQAHRLDASIPARLGDEDTVFHLSGTLWLARGVPEQAEVEALVALARRPDFFLGVPAVAKITPAQARLFSEIVRELAGLGLPCACEVESRYQGSGPMADLANRIPARFSLAFQDVSRARLGDELFAFPASARPPRR